MKTSERHHLKENMVAVAVQRTLAWSEGRGRQIGLALGAVALVAATAGGYWFWQSSRLDKAAVLAAEARATAEAPIVAPSTPEPGATAPPPPALSFPTEAARRDAALKKYQEVAATYPDTRLGLAARFQAASLLAESGKLSEAEALFTEVARQDGDGLHGRMARLGVAAIQVRTSRLDPAIQTFSQLSQRTDTDLPVDGILMQLGDAYEKAGRIPEALRAFMRITEDFPESPYAADAKTRADRLKDAPPQA